MARRLSLHLTLVLSFHEICTRIATTERDKRSAQRINLTAACLLLAPDTRESMNGAVLTLRVWAVEERLKSLRRVCLCLQECSVR